MKNIEETVISHYVPKCYQKEWLVYNKLFYYNKAFKLVTKGSKDGLTRPSERLMMEEYYYKIDESIDPSNYFPVNHLENYFNKNFENEWNKKVFRIAKSLKKCKSFLNLNKNDICFLLKFASIQYYRIKENAYSSILKIEPALRLAGYKGKIEKLNFEEIWKLTLAIGETKDNKFQNLETKFLNCKVDFLIYEGIECFICSDNPVVFNYEYAYFAIMPRICLKIYLEEKRDTPFANKITLNDNDFRRINRLIYNNTKDSFAYIKKLDENIIQDMFGGLLDD